LEIPHSRRLCDLLSAQADRFPHRPALCAIDQPPLTYSALWQQIQKVSQQFSAMGIGRNDRIALVLPNGPAMAVAFLAVSACATCAPLNPAYRRQEFEFYLADLDAHAIIVQEGMGSDAIAVAQQRGVPVIWLTPLLGEAAGLFTLHGADALSPRPPQYAVPEDIALVLHTSGTTSRPKIVPLTQRNLLLSASNIAHHLKLTAEDRCLNIMPLFHIHGLVGALLSSLTAGASIVCTPGFYAPQFFPWMAQAEPTWYTAVPTMHQAILARAAATDQGAPDRPLRLIRSSSSALPPQVMQDLERVFDCPVIEAYGMTEAAHQMASNPLPPLPRKPGSVGPMAGPQVAIFEASGQILPPYGVGEVVIRGESVFHGYANNPEADAAAFTEGWFRTGDQGYLDADGYLFLTGRLKELINRGGEKIAPREIDEALLDHPAVSQAIAFAVPHMQLGETVAAAVVLRPGHTATVQELRLAASARLSDFKVPDQIVIVEEIPKGATGKIQRIGLAAKLGIRQPESHSLLPRSEFVAPRTQTEEVLALLLGDVLHLNQIGVHDHFLALGGDSILATQFVARVRETLQIELSLLAFFEAPTLADLAPIVEALILEDPVDLDVSEPATGGDGT